MPESEGDRAHRSGCGCHRYAGSHQRRSGRGHHTRRKRGSGSRSRARDDAGFAASARRERRRDSGRALGSGGILDAERYVRRDDRVGRIRCDRSSRDPSTPRFRKHGLCLRPVFGRCARGHRTGRSTDIACAQRRHLGPRTVNREHPRTVGCRGVRRDEAGCLRGERLPRRDHR